MNDWLDRTRLLIKKEGLDKLKKSHVLIVGLGGVGSSAAEFIARSGVGELTIIDGDKVDKTNINRQLPALHSTLNIYKTDLITKRVKDINPSIKVHAINKFMEPDEFEDLFQQNNFDYVIDAIDSVSPKIYLIVAAKQNKTKIISAMGAGGKIDPSKVKVSDISKTREDFLARTIRKRLKKFHIHKGVKCVFSTEIQNVDSLQMTDNTGYKKSHYGTISYMPALFGIYAAAEVIKHLLNKKEA
jgi:tRNA A37 threonylcarbamoyladenosine dehydratase